MRGMKKKNLLVFFLFPNEGNEGKKELKLESKGEEKNSEIKEPMCARKEFRGFIYSV